MRSVGSSGATVLDWSVTPLQAPNLRAGDASRRRWTWACPVGMTSDRAFT